MAKAKAKKRGSVNRAAVPSVPAASRWLQKTITELTGISNWPTWLRDHDRIAEQLRAESRDRFKRLGCLSNDPAPAEQAPPFAPLAVIALVAIIGNRLPLAETALAPFRTQFANAANSAGAIRIGKSKSYGSAHDAAVYVLRDFLQGIWYAADPSGNSLAADPTDYSAFETDKILENWQDVDTYLSHYSIEPDGATIAGRMQQELACIALGASSSQGLLPAGKVWRGKFGTLSEFKAFLKRHPDIEKQTKGQRLLVDANAVILAHEAENDAKFKALGADAEKVDAGRELRQSQIRKRKQAAGERSVY